MAYFDCIVGGGGGDGSTLTVTCYSGFAGLTISITNGVDTFSNVCPSTSPYEVEFDGLADGTWTISTVYSGQTYTKTVEINASTTFNPTPNGATVTPINNIQTWLHCANIWDKNYTTISQVLADTTTLLALVSSNNAVDYMVRSTGFATGVCANQTAMGYIGNNDYCANTLLADATWLNAIGNSTYFESVLNVKVPTMTSNTTPYGEVIATGAMSGYEAYHLFDGNSSTLWVYGDLGYVGYHFVNPVCVKRVVVQQYYDTGAHAGNYTIDASNTGATNDWTTLTSGTLPNTNTTEAINIPNNTDDYLYYRINVTTQYVRNTAFKSLQFYGRA